MGFIAIYHPSHHVRISSRVQPQPPPIPIRLLAVARDDECVYAVMEFLPGPRPGECAWLTRTHLKKAIPPNIGGELFDVVRGGLEGEGDGDT